MASLREVCADSAKKVCVSIRSVCQSVTLQSTSLRVTGRQLPGSLSDKI